MTGKRDLRGVHLWLLLSRASRSVEAKARRSVEAMGLCLSDFGVLEALLHKGPLTVGALGQKVLLSSGSMTAAVDRLARRNLVERADTLKDRRERVVCLTDAGRELIERLFVQHAKDLEAAFAPLDPAERATLAALLRKLGLQERKEG
jgi:MarR family 2-MHQ and catechol resistance regulon transcriptional repressor